MNHKLRDLSIQLPSYINPSQLHQNTKFVEATEDHPILVDYSQFEITHFKDHPSVVNCLRVQYPNAAGLRFRNVNLVEVNKTLGVFVEKIARSYHYFEVIFGSNIESNVALFKEFTLQEGNVKVNVIKLLPKNARIVDIFITRIPFQSTAVLRERLIKIFGKYGEILAMGLYISKEGDWFTGHRYATFNVGGLSKDQKMQLLNKPTKFCARKTALQ
jgi:hypothetical protein